MYFQSPPPIDTRITAPRQRNSFFFLSCVLLIVYGYLPGLAQQLNSPQGTSTDYYNQPELVTATSTDMCNVGASVVASWSDPTVFFSIPTNCSVCIKIESAGNCTCEPPGPNNLCCWFGIFLGSSKVTEKAWECGANWQRKICLGAGDYTLMLDACDGTTITLTSLAIPCGTCR